MLILQQLITSKFNNTKQSYLILISTMLMTTSPIVASTYFISDTLSLSGPK